MTECQNYGILNSADRKVTYSVTSYQCDNGLGPGWFRFQGSAGTRMPTSCPPRYKCDTNVPGWMNGGHPTVADGQVSRTVCWHWSSGCCTWSSTIRVRNCVSYYVYYLSSTPNNGQCDFRYCSTDWTQMQQTMHFYILVIYQTGNGQVLAPTVFFEGCYGINDEITKKVS